MVDSSSYHKYPLTKWVQMEYHGLFAGLHVNPLFKEYRMFIPSNTLKPKRYVNAIKTHCKNGHEFNEQNTYISPKSQKRSCRICNAANVIINRKRPGVQERLTETMRVWRAANTERDHRNWTENRKRKKEWLDSHKVACKTCGENRAECLDFHHRDPTQKKACLSVAVAHWSIERLQEEMDKCDIVCANCHRCLEAAKRNKEIM